VEAFGEMVCICCMEAFWICWRVVSAMLMSGEACVDKFMGEAWVVMFGPVWWAVLDT
jgi:hypothetical protein